MSESTLPILSLDEPEMYAIACAAALFGGLIRGFVGFGGASTLVLVLTQFYDPTSVIARVAVIDLFANFRLLPTTWKEIEWRTAAPVTIATCLAMPLGIWVLIVADPVIMKRGIAAVVAVSTLALLSGRRFSAPATLPVLIGIGVVTGVILGASMVALTFMIFVYALPLTAAVSRATGILWGFFVSLAMIVIFMVTGDLTWIDLVRGGLVGLVFLGGAWVGSNVFRRVNEDLFRRIVLIFLLVLSIIGMVT